MGRFFARLVMVPLGFVLAILTAIAVLVTLGSEQLTHAMGGFDTLSAADAFDLSQRLIGLLSTITLVPAVLVVIVGEVARIKSAYFYVIGGGLALCALPAIDWLGPGGSAGSGPAIIVWQVFATAGFIAGFVYWFVAGRGA